MNFECISKFVSYIKTNGKYANSIESLIEDYGKKFRHLI